MHLRDLVLEIPQVPTNIYDLHTAVMAFMHPDRRDATRDFIFTLDPVAEQDGDALVIIRSRTFPAGLHGASVEIPKRRQPFDFALRGMPVYSEGGKRPAIRDPERQVDWMLREASKAGFIVQDLDDPIQTDRLMCTRGRQTWLNDVVFTGSGVMVNPTAFQHQIAIGMGRGRAYGYGLLRWHPTA